MATVNLSPYTAESEAIARRLRMAEALGQKAAQPLEMPTMPGVKISPYAGLAKMLESYTAGQDERAAREESKALGEKYQKDISADYSTLLKGLTPTAAVPEGAPTYMPNVDQRDVAENSRMVMQPELNEMGEIIAAGQPGAGNFGVTPGTPAIAATTGELSAKDFQAMRTPEGQQQYMAQLLAQIAPKEGMVLPEGSSYITKAGKVLIQGTGKEDFFNPKNEFDPISGQTLTVAYTNKGNRKVIDTKGAYTPDQWNSIPVAERAKMAFDQYKFGNVSATDLMQAAQKNVQLGQELAKLGFDIGPSAAGGGVRLPVNAPMPPIPGTPPTANAPAIPAAMPAALAGAQPVAARPMPAMPVAARPAAATPTVAAAPVAVAPVVPPATPNAQVALSPRARQELEKARQLEEFKGMNEGQSNAALFGGAMNQAQTVIKQLENEGTVKNAILPSVLQSLVKLVPFGPGEQAANIIESIARTDPTSLFGPDQNQQKLGQAQIAFATAWLRKTSGAAFGGNEISNTIKEYFPLIGEGADVIKQKAEARDRAIEGLKLSTGAQGKAYIEKYGGTPTGGASSPNDPFGLRKK